MIRWRCQLAAIALAGAAMAGCQSQDSTNGEQTVVLSHTVGGGETSGESSSVAAVTQTASSSVAPLTAAGFAADAFPPTLSDSKWHRDAWAVNDCLRCHETGVGQAPPVVHRGMPDVLLEAKCRSCHVLVPGAEPRFAPLPDPTTLQFALDAFPPMIPSSGSHEDTWMRDDCLLCHESGIRDAPIVEHRGLPPLLLRAKCRSCHVQVRAIESTVSR